MWVLYRGDGVNLAHAKALTVQAWAAREQCYVVAVMETVARPDNQLATVERACYQGKGDTFDEKRMDCDRFVNMVTAAMNATHLPAVLPSEVPR